MPRLMIETAYTIRAATDADLPTIIALDQEIFGWYGAQEEPAIIRARLAVFVEGFIVIEDAQEIIGYVSTEKWTTLREPRLNEDPFMSHDPHGRTLCITTLALQEKHQQRGLGKMLLDRVIAVARSHECTEIVLETAHAERFYLRAGFTRIGERQQRNIPLAILRLVL